MLERGGKIGFFLPRATERNPRRVDFASCWSPGAFTLGCCTCFLLANPWNYGTHPFFGAPPRVFYLSVCFFPAIVGDWRRGKRSFGEEFRGLRNTRGRWSETRNRKPNERKHADRAEEIALRFFWRRGACRRVQAWKQGGVQGRSPALVYFVFSLVISPHRPRRRLKPESLALLSLACARPRERKRRKSMWPSSKRQTTTLSHRRRSTSEVSLVFFVAAVECCAVEPSCYPSRSRSSAADTPDAFFASRTPRFCLSRTIWFNSYHAVRGLCVLSRRQVPIG